MRGCMYRRAGQSAGCNLGPKGKHRGVSVGQQSHHQQHLVPASFPKSAPTCQLSKDSPVVLCVHFSYSTVSLCPSVKSPTRPAGSSTFLVFLRSHGDVHSLCASTPDYSCRASPSTLQVAPDNDSKHCIGVNHGGSRE